MGSTENVHHVLEQLAEAHATLATARHVHTIASGLCVVLPTIASDICYAA